MMNPNNSHIDRNDSAIDPQGAAAAETGRTLKQMGRAVKENLNRQVQFMLNSCVNCGLCAESCHYYCATGDSDLIPANKFKKVHKILQTHFHPLKSRLPFLLKTDKFNEHLLTDLYKAAYENCTLCGKCALTCPMGINTAEILYLARAMLAAIGRLTSGLEKPLETFLW
jgi:Fe-S oxidoreductase